MKILIISFLVFSSIGVSAKGGAAAKAPLKASKCLKAVQDLAAAPDAALLDIQAAKSEIADLLIEKSLLVSPAEASLRTIIEKNLKKKMAEFKETFGLAIDPKEINEIIKQLEDKKSDKKIRDQKSETSVRDVEKNSKLTWSLTPTPVKTNFLPQNLRIEPKDVKVINGESGNLRIVYKIQESAAAQRGYHILDVSSGADIYVGDRLDSLEFYRSAKEDLVLTVPWVGQIGDSVIQIRDPQTGQVIKDFALPKLVPNFNSRKLLSQPHLIPYEKHGGELGVVFTWSTGVNKPDAVFELNPSTGQINEIGAIEDDSRVYRSADNKRIYVYSLTALKLISPTDARKTLAVTDLLNNTELYRQELTFGEKVLGDMLKTRDVAFIEVSPGKTFLGLNFYSKNETLIHDISKNKTETFSRSEDANSGGDFVSGNGTLYFLPTPASNDFQSVINLQTKKVELRHLGHFYNNIYASSVNVPELGPVVMYDADNADGKGQFLNIIALADSNLGLSSFNITGLDASGLLKAFAGKDGRVFGIFSNNFGSSLRAQNNLHLLQLYGPPPEIK